MTRSGPIGPGHLAAFVAETALLVCLWVAGLAWGESRVTSYLFAVLLVAGAVIVWGRWCAPRASGRLPRTPRWAFKITLSSVMLTLMVLSGASGTWVVVGVLTWLLMAGTLPWDTHEVG